MRRDFHQWAAGYARMRRTGAAIRAEQRAARLAYDTLERALIGDEKKAAAAAG